MSYDWLELQRIARQGFENRLSAVTDWSAPTPDTEWDVATLVRHVVDEQRWVPPLLAGKTIAEAEADLVPLGDDLSAEWDRH
ncbi:MAG: maleylpyruvate isomerase N-terminal domain-containing protein, partial [Rhodococcus sp. (in: high G+C Gram-positive bacteria)]|nr:maleylpyruvate isomerase N-terminal domain-containing protein [Rhodococcus sp. (in: high G+C Gram-positive bacteria)]MDX5451934.1 maleylpyruvate isomerase N-terminal domain-containing protein [Rhodococcus sp. (in: high G+C Gram-positive bacteria)]